MEYFFPKVRHKLNETYKINKKYLIQNFYFNFFFFTNLINLFDLIRKKVMFCLHDLLKNEKISFYIFYFKSSYELIEKYLSKKILSSKIFNNNKKSFSNLSNLNTKRTIIKNANSLPRKLITENIKPVSTPNSFFITNCQLQWKTG